MNTQLVKLVVSAVIVGMLLSWMYVSAFGSEDICTILDRDYLYRDRMASCDSGHPKELVASLNDPFSKFYDPEEATAYEESFNAVIGQDSRPNVEYSHAGNVGIIIVRKMNEDMMANFTKAVHKLAEAKVGAVIVDLRESRGGLVDAPREMIGYWFSGYTKVFSLRFANGRAEEKKSILGIPYFEKVPTAVLVGPNTASAAEMFAAAMKYYGKAKIFGQATFGKGVGQSFHYFADGSLLKFVTFEWFDPGGKSVNEIGIKPDFETDNPFIEAIRFLGQ